ncbi:WD repeat-containing protein 46 [Phaenicophaeus curvirostris]|uniref:WD repeat-containing protein 46 n=1 Tax=Phaenicophaeus curvirostris TaxID=33595 RepID=UPI0037F0A6C7
MAAPLQAHPPSQRPKLPSPNMAAPASRFRSPALSDWSRCRKRRRRGPHVAGMAAAAASGGTGGLGGARGGPGVLSGRKDPFPGPPPLPRPRLKRFLRGGGGKAPRARDPRLRRRLRREEGREEAAAEKAARLQLLLPQEAGFLEPDPDEDPCSVTQGDIADAVDIASAAKHFELRLEQFGPYRLRYSRNGRQLLLGGRRGHVAALDWVTKELLCEMNVMESVSDVTWLHAETLLAVAQRRWLHVYDRQGLELSCLRRCHRVLRLQFLPYHFLLATADASGFLQYLDVSVGAEVAALCTRGGRPAAMGHNPANAVVHLGHGNGTVTLWSPKAPEPLVRMLCHRGAVRALDVDPSGTYMATSGLDRKLRVFDLRTLNPVQELLLPLGATDVAFSQRGLLAAACGDVVQVFQGVGAALPPPRPFLRHRPPCPPLALSFCPFEDVLGVGHGSGFSSLLVPGSGEPNPDALEVNPYRSRRQRQEWEVKALLEKIPAELITLDPSELGRVDTATLQQKREERIERLGFDPQAKAPFRPRRRAKGSAPQRRKRQVAHEEQRAVIRESVEQRQQQQEEKKKKGGAPPVPPKRGALERFKK